MALKARSVALNVGSVVAGLGDGFLLLWTITFMASALNLAFANHYLLLGLLMCLVALILVVGLVLTIWAAREGHSERGLNVAKARRVAAYLLPLLLVSSVASFIAWAVTAGITGSIY
jgi:hypothetical protein